VIWLVILILLVISLLSVYSSTGSLAYQYRGGNTIYYLLRQFRFILLGVFIIFFVHLIPYQVFSRLSVVALWLAIPLLILTLVAGQNINDATRWLQIPGTSFTIQTSDFAKIALIMYLAKVLSVNQHNIGNFRDVFGKVTIAIVGVCGLILPANFSTAALVFLTAFSLMFVARIPIKYLALMVFSGVFAFAIFIGGAKLLGFEGRIETWQNRIESFASGEGDSYQADQAKVAVVQGGLFGKGPGNSTQRNLVPHPYSDFIYAIIIEEYGSLIGGILVLALYLWLFYRAGLIIRRSRSTYGAFLAFGLSMGLVVQAFVNMAVAVGLMPVTGQTLPLVSMGGSSIIFTSMAAGMILSVSWGTDESRVQAQGTKVEGGIGADDQVERPIYEAAGPVDEGTKNDADQSAGEKRGRKNEKRTRTEFDDHA